MSTLKVNTIQDASGNNGTTPALLYNGTAKAWVNFNGTGTVAIRASYNVAGITDNGVGNFTVNFTAAFPDTSYLWSGGARFTTSTDANAGLGSTSTDIKTTTAFQVRCFDCAVASSSSPQDSTEINLHFNR